MWDSTEVKENTACFGFWRVFVVGRARNSEGKGTREGRASACSSSCLRHPCCVLGPRNTQCTVTPFALNPTGELGIKTMARVKKLKGEKQLWRGSASSNLRVLLCDVFKFFIHLEESKLEIWISIIYARKTLGN